ncbi:hypothetical protein CR513_37487, partial [Mucuna pruriens]
MAKVLGEANFGKIYRRPSSGTRYSVMNYVEVSQLHPLLLLNHEGSPPDSIVSVVPQGDANWRVNANPREAPPNMNKSSASVFASWKVNKLNQERSNDRRYLRPLTESGNSVSLDSFEDYHLGMPVWQTTPNNDLFVIAASDVLLTA